MCDGIDGARCCTVVYIYVYRLLLIIIVYFCWSGRSPCVHIITKSRIGSCVHIITKSRSGPCVYLQYHEVRIELYIRFITK